MKAEYHTDQQDFYLFLEEEELEALRKGDSLDATLVYKNGNSETVKELPLRVAPAYIDPRSMESLERLKTSYQYASEHFYYAEHAEQLAFLNVYDDPRDKGKIWDEISSKGLIERFGGMSTMTLALVKEVCYTSVVVPQG